MSQDPEGQIGDRFAVDAVAMIETYRRRAGRSRGLAFGILGVIFMLLAGGALAFVFASQITLSDFNQGIDIDKKLSEIDAQITAISAQIKLENDKNTAERNHVYDVMNRNGKIVDAIFGVDCLDITDSRPIADITTGGAYYGEDHQNLVTDIKKVVESTKKPYFIIGIGDVNGIAQTTYKCDTHVIENITNQMAKIVFSPVPPLPPSGIPIDPPTKSRLKLLGDAKQILELRKEDKDIKQLVGDSAPDRVSSNSDKEPIQKADASVSQLIQTNVTRFGTIIMITFLVSILTPLYRYNIRLATYYDARADALTLSGSKFQSASFATLIGSLTPTFDFGKTPSTPLEQVIELVRNLRTPEKSQHPDT